MPAARSGLMAWLTSSMACDNATSGRRSNEKVTEGSCPKWLTESGPNPGSWERAFREAGYSVQTLRGEGSGNSGAKAVRIEAARRKLPSCWFDEKNTRAGLDALIAYHEKRDEKRGIGLGPAHDWASHGADAFGLMAVAHEDEQKPVKLDLSNLKRGMV